METEARLKHIIESMGFEYRRDALWDEVGADSLDLVELVMACEEEFGQEIRDEDAEKLNTPADAIAYLEAKATAGGAA